MLTDLKKGFGALFTILFTSIKVAFNPFDTNVPFLYSLETSENLWYRN